MQGLYIQDGCTPSLLPCPTSNLTAAGQSTPQGLENTVLTQLLGPDRTEDEENILRKLPLCLLLDGLDETEPPVQSTDDESGQGGQSLGDFLATRRHKSTDDEEGRLIPSTFLDITGFKLHEWPCTKVVIGCREELFQFDINSKIAVGSHHAHFTPHTLVGSGRVLSLQPFAKEKCDEFISKDIGQRVDLFMARLDKVVYSKRTTKDDRFNLRKFEEEVDENALGMQCVTPGFVKARETKRQLATLLGVPVIEGHKWADVERWWQFNSKGGEWVLHPKDPVIMKQDEAMQRQPSPRPGDINECIREIKDSIIKEINEILDIKLQKNLEHIFLPGAHVNAKENPFLILVVIEGSRVLQHQRRQDMMQHSPLNEVYESYLQAYISNRLDSEGKQYPELQRLVPDIRGLQDAVLDFGVCLALHMFRKGQWSGKLGSIAPTTVASGDVMKDMPITIRIPYDGLLTSEGGWVKNNHNLQLIPGQHRFSCTVLDRPTEDENSIRVCWNEVSRNGPPSYYGLPKNGKISKDWWDGLHAQPTTGPDVFLGTLPSELNTVLIRFLPIRASDFNDKESGFCFRHRSFHEFLLRRSVDRWTYLALSSRPLRGVPLTLAMYVNYLNALERVQRKLFEELVARFRSYSGLHDVFRTEMRGVDSSQDNIMHDLHLENVPRSPTTRSPIQQAKDSVLIVKGNVQLIHDTFLDFKQRMAVAEEKKNSFKKDGESPRWRRGASDAGFERGRAAGGDPADAAPEGPRRTYFAPTTAFGSPTSGDPLVGAGAADPAAGECRQSRYEEVTLPPTLQAGT